MKFDLTKKPLGNRKAISEWHLHFQLTPRIIVHNGETYFVWLETVERRWYASQVTTGMWLYRMPREGT